MHLSYCTNVHPAEDLEGIIRQLDAHAVPVRRRLEAGPLGLGLWLAAPVAAELAGDPAARRRLRRALDSRGLEVVTLNGFPYRGFHAPVVKHAVYHPDWTTRRRLRYTLNLARVLSDLLPDTASRGSISTLPLAWREPWDAGRADTAARRLDELARGLAGIARATGRVVRVGLEPEPGCVLESSAQTADLPSADPEWIGVCLDLAHLACAWEDPETAVARLRTAGRPVVKVQVSAALEVADPPAAAGVLREYAEPRFLHQVRNRAGGTADDLPEALERGLAGPWRIHYHVPLHAAPSAPLASTVPVVRDALEVLLGGPEPVCDHFEVETYTWSVLPRADRPDTLDGLTAGIAAELAFARTAMRPPVDTRSTAGLERAGEVDGS